MGLDSVELVMMVEEHFDITIPDEAASELATVGDIHQFIVEELSRLGRNPSPAIVFADLRYIIVDQFGVKMEQVVPEARIVKDLGID